jgi:hypothetical protein
MSSCSALCRFAKRYVLLKVHTAEHYKVYQIFIGIRLFYDNLIGKLGLSRKPGTKISWPKDPASHIKAQKITHIPRKMLEFSVFWDFNILGIKHSFELKFSRSSTDK